MRKQIAIIVSLLFLIPVAEGVQEFFSLYRSVRSLSLGNAFHGHSEGEEALFMNPAGLSLYKGRPQFNLVYKTELSSTSLSLLRSALAGGFSGPSSLTTMLGTVSGNPGVLGATFLPYFVKHKFGFGFLANDAKVDVGLIGKDVEASVDITAISDMGFVLGYGSELFENFHMGANVRLAGRGGGHKNIPLADLVGGTSLDLAALQGAGLGVDGDIGLTYVLPKFASWIEHNRVSLVLNNVLGSSLTLLTLRNTPPPGLVRMLSLGTATVFPGIGVIDQFTFLISLAEFSMGGENDPNKGARVGSFWKHLNFGIEIPFRRWFVLRGGIHQGYFGGGFGINLPVLRLEGGIYTEELGVGVDRIPSTRYMFSLALGTGGRTTPVAPEPSPEPVVERPEPKPETPPATPEKKVSEEKPVLNPAPKTPENPPPAPAPSPNPPVEGARTAP